MKVSVIADDLAQGARAPNYYPNSFPGPKPDISAKWPTYELKGKWGRYEYVHPNDDYVQPAALYNKVMTDVDRAHLISNVVGHLGGAKKETQMRQVAVFYTVDPDYGSRVAQGLGLKIDEVKKLAEK